eukprot:2746764-Rhodomonas_salina.2
MSTAQCALERRVSGHDFEVSGHDFEVSGLDFEVSGLDFEVSGRIPCKMRWVSRSASCSVSRSPIPMLRVNW